MSQPNRPRKGPPAPPPNVLPGVISALVVVAVLGLLFVLLATRPSPQQTAQYTSETAQTLQATNQVQQQLDATAAAASVAPTVAAAGAPTAAAQAKPATGTKTYTAPPMTIDPAKNYTATITTPRGDIVVKLRPDLAPETVNSFVFLSKQGFYNGLTWHRVIQGFMAQGGDPTGTGTGGPGYSVKAEFTDKVLFDKPGIVAMARASDPNSAGSQFFITTAPAPNLNKQYTVFGEVTKGQDIVTGIPLRDPDTATTPGEQIQKITITEG